MINTLFRMKRPFALPVSSMFVGLSQPQPTSTVQILPVSTPAAILAPSGIPIKLGLGLLEEEIGPSIASTAASSYINPVPKSNEEDMP